MEITWKYPDDSVAPLAEWGVALAYYRRGGPGWALFAAEDFNQYCKKHSDSEELDFLVQAAANNRAVIERGLMEFDPSELLVPQGPTKGELSSDPIKMTRITVEAFMTEFPQSSLKTNAQQVLARIQNPGHPPFNHLIGVVNSVDLCAYLRQGLSAIPGINIIEGRAKSAEVESESVDQDREAPVTHKQSMRSEQKTSDRKAALDQDKGDGDAAKAVRDAAIPVNQCLPS